MSTATGRKEDEDEIPQLEKPPSPPPHTTFAARGVLIPTFSAFRPRDMRITSSQAMTHVAWNADGRKLAAVGIDRIVRVFQPEKSLEMRSATLYSGGHSDDVDYVAWHPIHSELFCSSSQRDRRITFWDARQSRHVQQLSLKYSPLEVIYSPDGRRIMCVSTNTQLIFLEYGKSGDDTKESWHPVIKVDKGTGHSPTASTAIFNHTGEEIISSNHNTHSLRTQDYETFSDKQSVPAHVGGCSTIALDPRGRYIATGSYDSIVNLFDTTELICVRTIAACDNAITALSFSYDGEFLAIANTGTYIDICATETGVPLHRVPALAPSSAVAWHPWKHAIAYCGQTKAREGGPPPAAVLSIFGAT
ncbi:WD40 repeat-like protein [Gloeophyllum trabeum ATCC 11539]|uniref:WD40 repeat-like protein n=1 Tax=Gloeophyllum trabeum (strain ATCC 11539 / FP-39264 / Madison 617) TaxID=670483 RepID=S7RWA6_GLOTA|nr:WD40 repeat-like protein [Gloeophyllum trabeum ATCC 11539]EPQ59160.1 WD40 repeat-like protein [Gloeophyllum trabeum ATCC 11539]